ncbi:glycerate kinase [Anaerostipes sp.]|uniref:glycerate kinase family protein n=1 Tax=Anaerostipes sp. TaxID=1872530 RepID=UPI003966C96A
MKVVIAIDSLKGSLTSIQAAHAIEKGIKKVEKEAEVVIKPLADGGEGTVDALVDGMGGNMEFIKVTGPAGKPVLAKYGIILPTKSGMEGTSTVIMEMSQAAGITQVSDKERNPLYTTTYGVGQMITDAIHKGCRRFIMGIGGSATNDGGAGMLQALGYDFLDKDGNQIKYGAIGLKDLAKIKDDHVISELKDCEFHIACDVTNPLCGEEGCSAIFGPQKGATKQMVKDMDQWLTDYAKIAKQSFTKADANKPGTGAAGGLGFAFLTFTNATLKSGVDLILHETKLEEEIKDADIVITGEGCLDAQTAMGKAPIGVAKLAKKYGKLVLGFSGSVTKGAAACNEAGIDAYFPIVRSAVSLEDAMKKKNAKENLMDTVEQVFRLVKVLK